MRKPVLYLLLLFRVISFAQEKKLEIDFKSPKGAMAAYDTYSFVNKEKNRVCILAIGNLIIRGYILDSNYVLLKEFKDAKPEGYRELVGGYFKDDKVHYLLARSEDDDEMEHFTYDQTTETITKNLVNLDIRRSMFVGGLSLGDQFLFVSVKKKEDKIMVYRFGRNESFETLQFEYPASSLERESLYFALSSAYGLSRISEVSYINDRELPSAGKVKKYCKMHYRNDSLIITIDRTIGKVYVLSLDLIKQTTSGRYISRQFSSAGMDFQVSSFLLDNHLYSVISSMDKLQFTVFDFYTGRKIREYITNKDEDIPYRSTDVVQEGSTYFSGERKLEKTRQLLRKMTNGRIVVMADNRKDGAVELTIGSYKEVRSGGGGMWMGGTTPGSAPVFIPTGGFSREWVQSARFKTVLGRDSFEKTGGDIQKPVEERIEEYTKDIRIPAGCEGIYPVGQKLAYYYLDRKTGKLVVSAL